MLLGQEWKIWLVTSNIDFYNLSVFLKQPFAMTKSRVQMNLCGNTTICRFSVSSVSFDMNDYSSKLIQKTTVLMLNMVALLHHRWVNVSMVEHWGSPLNMVEDSQSTFRVSSLTRLSTVGVWLCRHEWIHRWNTLEERSVRLATLMEQYIRSPSFLWNENNTKKMKFIFTVCE